MSLQETTVTEPETEINASIIKWENDNKKKKPELESIIKSERYTIKGLLGRGCWGRVFEGYDKLLEQEVAIKILDPLNATVEQMIYRNLDEFNAMRKEGGKLTACANIVPRRFEVDAHGKPFIVMPKYNKFFSDVLNDAFASRKTRTIASAFGEEKLFDSGLSTDEIIKYSRHIINGIAEIHKIYKKAHCDLKPDNLAVDDDGKVLVSDMGTSTYASFVITGAPRDNMGFLYTRSPRLFAEGEHPVKSSDAYAFGCLLYKMLAGEYPFEKEIDEAVKKGDLKEVKEFMKIFYEKIGNSGSVTHSLTIQEAIDKKLKKTDIPEPFKKLIVNCIQEYCRDGESLKRDFEESVTQCFEAKVKKKAVDEFKSKLKKKLVAGLATGTVLAGLGLGLAWVAYLAPRPDYSKRTDITTRVEMRNFKDSGVSFEIDKAYENNQLDVKKTDTYKNLADMHRMRFKDKSLVDKMVSVWIKTASEFNEFVDGHDLIAPIDYQARGTELSPGTFSGMGAYFLNDYLRELLAYGISINQTRKNVADLEDTLATTYLGTNLVLKAQKAANSFEVDKYLSAKDESGKYLIHEARQRFLKKLIYNISTDKELSQNIHLK